MPPRTLQTTFIPRGNLSGAAPAGGRRRTINVFFIFALGAFLLSAVGYGGAVLYRGVAKKTIADLGVSLQRARDAFDPGLLFEFDRADRKIEAAKLVLADHVTLQPLFAVLDQATLKSVRFSSFDYRLDQFGKALIDINGKAGSFASVALQSDSFVETKRLRNVVFSNLQVAQAGGVNFSMTAEVDPALLSYKRTAPTVASARQSAAGAEAAAKPSQQ